MCVSYTKPLIKGPKSYFNLCNNADLRFLQLIFIAFYTGVKILKDCLQY